MSDVKWIKITTDIFDDDKILLIESLPEADSIIVIWFKLLCLAGKLNNSGVFIMNGKMAYTDKMLATIFRRKEATVRLALETFEAFGMVEIVDEVITIPNWGKHQSLDQLENKREYMRSYMQEYRRKQQDKICKTNNKVYSKSNVSEADKDIDKDIDIDKDNKDKIKNKNNIKNISIDKNIVYEGGSDEPTANATQTKHRYGKEYNNVLLTDDEFNKLKNLYPDIEERIERLSNYIASTGKKYKSHYATIKNWARMDEERQQNSRPTKNNAAQSLEDSYEMMSRWAQEGEENAS